MRIRTIFLFNFLFYTFCLHVVLMLSVSLIYIYTPIFFSLFQMPSFSSNLILPSFRSLSHYLSSTRNISFPFLILINRLPFTDFLSLTRILYFIFYHAWTFYAILFLHPSLFQLLLNVSLPLSSLLITYFIRLSFLFLAVFYSFFHPIFCFSLPQFSNDISRKNFLSADGMRQSIKFYYKILPHLSTLCANR